MLQNTTSFGETSYSNVYIGSTGFQVSLGLWQKKFVAVSTPATTHNEFGDFREDFEHGLRSFLELGAHDRVVQLLGFCLDPLTIVTEYHQLGNAAGFLALLQSETFRQFDTLRVRFHLCLDYVEILSWLHSSSAGPRVMCDSSDLTKTLEQYLLTDNLRLVLNDLDALPHVNRLAGILVKCGHRQLVGEFVAPEQRWPYGDRDYSDEAMPHYDEKTDIWKIPDICNYFLHGASDREVLSFHLFDVHRRCKAHDPLQRPTAQHIVDVYNTIWQNLF